MRKVLLSLSLVIAVATYSQGQVSSSSYQVFSFDEANRLFGLTEQLSKIESLRDAL